jgi:hypothetical protein
MKELLRIFYANKLRFLASVHGFRTSQAREVIIHSLRTRSERRMQGSSRLFESTTADVDPQVEFKPFKPETIIQQYSTKTNQQTKNPQTRVSLS